MDQYPNRIYELRRARGLSQEALGVAIGTTKMSVSRMERGMVAVSIDDMRAIAAVFGCRPADLLSLDDNPMRLNDAELELLERYRAADDRQRADIQRVTEALVPFVHDEADRSAA